MEIRNAKADSWCLLSWFSESFSRPSLKIFSSLVISFIQLGKEVHTFWMVQSLNFPFLHRPLSRFSRFRGKNVWTMEEMTRIAVYQFFHHLPIKTPSGLFFIVDDTIAKKTGKKMPGCGWHKDQASNPHVFSH
jgi:hypothetical protein